MRHYGWAHETRMFLQLFTHWPFFLAVVVLMGMALWFMRGPDGSSRR